MGQPAPLHRAETSPHALYDDLNPAARAPQPALIGRRCITECVCMCIVRWYNTMSVCIFPVLVHYSIVVNPCRPIRAGCGALACGQLRSAGYILEDPDAYLLGRAPDWSTLYNPGSHWSTLYN